MREQHAAPCDGEDVDPRPPGAERATRPAVAREIPHNDLTAGRGSVEPPPVAADREPSELAGLAVKGVDGLPAGDVPDDHPVVVAGCDRGLAVRAERRARHRPGMAPRAQSEAPTVEIDEAHRAVEGA